MIAVERVNGSGEIAALEFGPLGRGLDIVFLHANGFNAGTYRQALAPLGATLRVLAVDMRGHGRTTLPTPIEGHAWRIYADDLLALLSALGEVPRVLAGHSMGGTTALLAAPQLAKLQPTALVLFDPVVAPPAAYETGGAADWNQPLAQGALRRKSAFAMRAEANAAYRGRGAFKTWPDTMLDDYLEDGLRPDSNSGFHAILRTGLGGSEFCLLRQQQSQCRLCRRWRNRPRVAGRAQLHLFCDGVRMRPFAGLG